MPFKKFKPFKLNDKGEEIRKIARLLKVHGSTIKPTDTFHIGMLSAVKKYQKNHGLEVTGVVDKKTWDKLVMPPPVARKSRK